MFGAEQRAAPEIVADEAGRNKLVHQGHVSCVHKVRQGSAHKSLVILPRGEPSKRTAKGGPIPGLRRDNLLVRDAEDGRQLVGFL